MGHKISKLHRKLLRRIGRATTISALNAHAATLSHRERGEARVAMEEVIGQRKPRPPAPPEPAAVRWHTAEDGWREIHRLPPKDGDE